MSKKRGIAAERELLHLLWQNGYAVARVAGSGSIPKPSCDLLAGNGKTRYAIECKICRKEKKYLSKKQIDEFVKFSKKFGLEPLLAIKFFRKGWFFVSLKSLRAINKTGKSYVISLKYASTKGKNLI